MSDKTYIGKRVAALERGKPYEEISKVIGLLETSDGEMQEVEVGDTTGRTMEVSLQGVTDALYAQQIAQEILQSINGYVYRPYRAKDALSNPAVELGDGVTIDGLYSVIAASDEACDELYSASLSAESFEEIKNEFIFQPGAQRTIERKLAQTRASLRIDVDGISARVDGLDDDFAALDIRVDGISSEVSGKIDGQQAQTLINQTLEDISLSVSGTDGTTTFKLKQGAATLSTTTFDLHVDAVNIEGTLTADEIRGSTFKLLDDDDDTAATFYLTGASSIDDQKMVIDTGALELDSNGGDVFIAANTYRGALVSAIHIKGGYDEVACVGDFVPNSSGTYNLGRSDLYWNNIYCYNSAVDLSDRKEKTDIDYALAMDAFFDGLRPASFKMRHGTSGRTHYGMIAQDVEDLLISLGMSGTDFAGFVKSAKDGETHYGLRYGEFIPLCIDQIQKLKTRVNELERAS